MGKASRDKGAKGELEVAAILRERGFEASRNARNGVAGIDGGQDIAHGIEGFWLEVKRAETVQLQKWLDQAEEDAPEDHVPVVVFRRSRQPWRVCLTLDALLDLLEKR